jgi:integrase
LQSSQLEADKSVTKRIALELENRTALRREGLVDPKQEAYLQHESVSLLVHIEAWTDALLSRGGTSQHVKLHTSRAMRVIALFKGANLAEIEPKKPATKQGVAQSEATLRRFVSTARIDDLTPEQVQRALAGLTTEGRSFPTANHHRNAIKSFAIWMFDTCRTRENQLRRVAGFNVKEDPRHERRTISLEELRQLIDAAENGPVFKNMTGHERALCHRLAVASGLRYSELASFTPPSFDWHNGTVTIKAAYAKNGQTTTLPIAAELVADLASDVASIPADKPIFSLPHDKGAAMVRLDLEAAGISYRDAAGRVFDFHSLRCQMATLADAAGVSPRVVQRMMRHSKLEMTGRYTRPRAVDLESAAQSLPSLRTTTRPEALAATGTDGQDTRATVCATGDEGDSPEIVDFTDFTSRALRKVNPLVEGSSPSPVTNDRKQVKADGCVQTATFDDSEAPTSQAHPTP